MELIFSRLFDNLLSKYLILKEFLAWNGYFGLFNTIKKGSGTSLRCIFSAWFSNKNVPYLIFYQWTKFQCHTFFPSQDIKQNVLLTLRIIFDQPLKQWLTGRKKREDGNTKIWISQEWKELFRWNKKHFFIVFEGLSFGGK